MHARQFLGILPMRKIEEAIENEGVWSLDLEKMVQGSLI
jgi:hypothetical protein